MAIRNGRDGAKDWTRLPAEGREGDPPEWPLSRPTARELELWVAEWRRPQAVMWAANGQAVEVALYVRSLKDAEKSAASVAARTLVKQQQEALGVSLPGLARNHWIIVTAEPVTQRQTAPTASARDRLRLVARGA